MKKIKKLTLNKEVISILAGNEMNRLKGGAMPETWTAIPDRCSKEAGWCGEDYENYDNYDNQDYDDYDEDHACSGFEACSDEFCNSEDVSNFV